MSWLLTNVMMHTNTINVSVQEFRYQYTGSCRNAFPGCRAVDAAEKPIKENYVCSESPDQAASGVGYAEPVNDFETVTITIY